MRVVGKDQPNGTSWHLNRTGLPRVATRSLGSATHNAMRPGRWLAAKMAQERYPTHITVWSGKAAPRDSQPGAQGARPGDPIAASAAALPRGLLGRPSTSS